MGSNVSAEQQNGSLNGSSDNPTGNQLGDGTTVERANAIDLREDNRLPPFSLSQKSRLERVLFLPTFNNHPFLIVFQTLYNLITVITVHSSLRSKLGERTKSGDILPVGDWFEEFDCILSELAPLESSPLSLLIESVSEDLKSFLLQKQFTTFDDAKASLFSLLSREVSSEERFRLLVHQQDVPACIAVKRARELLLPENKNEFFMELLLHSLSKETAERVRNLHCTTLEECISAAEAAEAGNQGFCKSKMCFSPFSCMPKCILQQVMSYLEFKDICSLLASSVAIYKFFTITHYKHVFADRQFAHNNANELAALLRIKKSDHLLMFGVLTNSHDQGWASNRQKSYTWIELDILKPYLLD